MLLDGRFGSVPLELVRDGDLLFPIRECFVLEVWIRFGFLRLRHADEGMVLNGHVREQDRLGNNAADEGPWES